MQPIFLVATLSCQWSIIPRLWASTRERAVSLLPPASLASSHGKELQVYLHLFQNSDRLTHLILKPLCKWSRRSFIPYLTEEGSASTKRHDLSKDWIIVNMSLCLALFSIYVYMCVYTHTYTHTQAHTHMHICIYMHLFIYWPYMVCGILVPEPGIQPAPPALERQGLSYWTTKEVPSRHCFRMWRSHRKSLHLWNLPSSEWEAKEKQ